MATLLSTTSSLADRLLASARGHIGIPYVWGGASEKGLDCSGLTQMIARENSISIPRTAAAQWAYFQGAGKTVSAAAAGPGDFVYMRSSGPSGWHTGIYIGNGKMIDAPGSGKVVRVDSLAGRTIVGYGRLPGVTSSPSIVPASTSSPQPAAAKSSSLIAFPEGFATKAGLAVFGVVFLIAAGIAIAGESTADLRAGITEGALGTSKPLELLQRARETGEAVRRWE